MWDKKNFKLRPDPCGPLARSQSTRAAKWKRAFLRAYSWFLLFLPHTLHTPILILESSPTFSIGAHRTQKKDYLPISHTHTFVCWYLHAKGPARGSGPWPHTPKVVSVEWRAFTVLSQTSTSTWASSPAHHCDTSGDRRGWGVGEMGAPDGWAGEAGGGLENFLLSSRLPYYPMLTFSIFFLFLVHFFAFIV